MKPPRMQLLPFEAVSIVGEAQVGDHTFRLSLIALLLSPSAGTATGLCPVCELLY